MYSRLTSKVASPGKTGGTEEILVQRGMVFRNLLDFFAGTEIDITRNKFEMNIVSPNRTVEVREDRGGVMRVALSEFWETFYDKCTIGENIKVPALSHSMQDRDWKACARIIVVGYAQEGYFPAQLAPCFLRYTMYGDCSQQDLTDAFVEYVPEKERDVIHQAQTDFSSVDYDELLDVLGKHGLTTIPRKDNFGKILAQIAHKDLIQVPAYVSFCWADILKRGLIPILKESIEDLCVTLLPQTRKVLSILDFPKHLTANEELIAEYLCRYIKGCSQSTLQAFLRFCTGSDLLVANKLTISFMEPKSNFTRSPIAHTCGYLLELPNDYADYGELKEEFESLLNDSGIWVMDVVKKIFAAWQKK